ncbi:MAG: hypothetical protein V4534_07545 [Myxococcota bacterium]
MSRVLAFIAYSNLFISLCAASLSAYAQAIFAARVEHAQVLLIFCSTFILYNGQRLYLSIFQTHQNLHWYLSHRGVLWCMMLAAGFGLYPLLFARLIDLVCYGACFLLALTYFLPVTNFRKMPVVKSLLVALVWASVCVLPAGPTVWFWTAQVCFIGGLCVLFNIRDMAHDTACGTKTVAVSYGVCVARTLAVSLFSLFLVFDFRWASTVVFGLACAFAFYARPSRHSYYYLYGVDGLILLQACLGLWAKRVVVVL